MMSARLFLAIPLDDITQTAFSQFKDCVPDPPEGLRWIGHNNWHITLLFIGNTPEEIISPIMERAEMVLRDQKPFAIQFDKYRLIFRKKYPSMLWAQYLPEEKLNDLVSLLHKSISEEMKLEKLRPEFLPHVTLARIKKSHDKKRIAWEEAPSPPDLIVKNVILFESQLTEKGAIYTPLATYDLKSPAG